MSSVKYGCPNFSTSLADGVAAQTKVMTANRKVAIDDLCQHSWLETEHAVFHMISLTYHRAVCAALLGAMKFPIVVVDLRLV